MLSYMRFLPSDLQGKGKGFEGPTHHLVDKVLSLGGWFAIYTL